MTWIRKPKVLQLLVAWKNSVYELVWFELIIYLAVYMVVNLIYRLALVDKDGKRNVLAKNVI